MAYRRRAASRRGGSRRMRTTGSRSRRVYGGRRRSSGNRTARTQTIRIELAPTSVPAVEAPAGMKLVPTKTAKF